MKHSFAFPRSTARLEGHSQPASCLGALHAPAPPRSSTAPRPDTPSVPPPPRHGSDTRQSPRPIITSPPRCPSPRCPTAASVAPAAAEPVVPAAPAAALPRGPYGPRGPVLARPPRLAPHASAPPARALRARRPRRRRGPPRATSRRPHRDPPPDAHASPSSPYPTLASTHRARTRHSRRQRHALHVRTPTPYPAAASLPSARPHARRPPPAFGFNSRVFHVKHSFASHPHRTPNVL